MVNTRRGDNNNDNVNDNTTNQRDLPPLPPLMDANQVMTILQGLVQAINQQPQVQQAPPQQPQSRLKTFLSTQPATFSQEIGPMEADDWLKTIESKLQIAQCTGREKVLCAPHQLIGPAQEWWIAYTIAHEDPQEITWADFRNSFHAHHVPAGEVKLKRKEQGPMSVREYLTKFT
ncbi:uncharacterized protein LOC133922963 [Phragmites australis]|uniref:uncharacterized protein LOC133922963 n=1 Tax=Phragmites australis TaxID=29695 RepID=UPI002D76AA42|nr:uncharacterized protein LOC133922963 [Phragmites australis]